MEWSIKSFEELGKQELYDILRLRAEVFVLEQDSPYNDLDGLDRTSRHLTATDATGELAVYLRILPVGSEREGMASLGRFIVAPRYRGLGLAREAMRRGIEACRSLCPEASGIAIQAQTYLEKFYPEFGFVSEGEPYELERRMHVDMILRF